MRLLELFAEAPRTTKQAAEHLGLPPTRLYHHVAALERVGLVRVRETRPNRGTIEKHFEAVARGFEMDPELLAPAGRRGARSAAGRLAGEGAAAIALRVIDRAGEELSAALDAAMEDPRLPEAERPLAVRVGIIASPRRVIAVRDRVLALIRELQAEAEAEERANKGSEDGEETMRAWMTIVLAPEVGPKGPVPAGKKPRKTRPRT
jgi:hypothetical protein